MNARQSAESIAILGAAEYATTLIPQFTHAPPTPVDTKFATARASLLQAISDLGGKQAIQSGGAYQSESSQQEALRRNLHEELGDVNFTARSIAAETGNPSLMDRFRMPDSRSDTALAAAGLAMAAAISELSLDAEFEAHGFPVDTPNYLTDLVQAFKASEGEQGASLGGQAGATAAIPGVLRSGKNAIRTLSAIFNRVFKGNPEILTAWATASHVERAPRHTTPPPAPQP